MRALLCICLAAAAWAQQSVTSATVTGRIRDASGGAIAGALVSAFDQNRGQSWTVRADAAGRYLFLRLAPGAYVLRASAERFEIAEQKLSLSAGQAIELPILLAVAGSGERIEVVAPLESVRTEAGATVGGRLIGDLPLNGRNYLDLALLAPGVSRTNTGAPQQFAETSAVPGTGISIAGQRNLNNTFVIDGLSANDDAAGLAGSFYSQEVIREFQVITSGANAEFGRASSGVVSIATRSGTNQWHGRAYGFLRNQRLDARNALASRRDPLTQAQYGASLGGPIARGRTFLFANAEQTHRNAAGIVTIAPANVAPIDAALDAFGYPGPRLRTGEYATGWDMTNAFARLDHQLSASNQLTARGSLYRLASPNARSVGGLNAESRGTRLDNLDSTFALNDAATLSPRALNEVRFQFTRSRLEAPGNDLTGPAVSIAGVANFGASTTSPTGRDDDLYELSETLSVERGAHLFKAGADFLYNRLRIVFPGSLVAPVYSFSSLAAFEAGRYTTFQQAFGEASQFQSNPNGGFFAQDEWKARPGLTLNLGLRYDQQFLPAPVRLDTNNIAPRFGIAWSPGGRGTVVRASYGLFYDRIPLRAVSNGLQRDGTKYRTALLAYGQPGAPAFPTRLADFPAGQYVNITTIDPRIGNSYAHQAGLQVDRSLGRATTLSAGYQWVRALHLILSRNLNVPTLSPAEAAAAGIPNLGRPDPRYGNISRYEGSGDAYFNGLLVSLRSHPRSGIDFTAAYTFSKTIDDIGNFFFSAPQDNFNLRGDRGLSDNDQRHRISVAAVLDSPAHGRLLGGWQLSPMLLYTSALPFNVQVNYDRNRDTNLNDRPAGVGRNTGHGFDFASLDLRLSRTFRAGERWRVQALAESFNTLNRTNRALPNNVIGTGTGAPLESFGRATAVYDPRQLQIGLRLDF